MSEVASGSVQAVVCSPPYWDLKDYGHASQIGHGESYRDYHRRLTKVWRECLRVLRPTGTLWIVVDKVWDAGALTHIPYHIAENCQRTGFYLKDLVIWNKPTAIAGMTRRNSVNKHETVVVLSKSKGNKGFQRGDRDFWRVVVKAGSIRRTPDHQAPYPEELVERILRAATSPGDLVVDPFLGSGTTAKVAVRLGRRCIGYEVNSGFAELIAQRVATAPPPSSEHAKVGGTELPRPERL